MGAQRIEAFRQADAMFQFLSGRRRDAGADRVDMPELQRIDSERFETLQVQLLDIIG